MAASLAPFMALRDCHISRRSQIPWDTPALSGHLQRTAAWPGAGSKVPTFILFPRISLVFPPVFYRDKKKSAAVAQADSKGPQGALPIGVQRLGTKIQTWDRGRCGAVNTGKWGAEGQGLGQLMPSTGSSISLCDAVCSCLISCSRHSNFSPGSRSSSGSRAPFQTKHPLEPSFENQLSLHSFRCLCRAFPSQTERWERQDVDGKTHPANTRLPEKNPSKEVGHHRRRKKGLTPPCHRAAAPPPSSPIAATLSGAFEASFLPLPPPTHRRPVQEQVWACCGVVGTPAQGCCQPSSPGTEPRPTPGSVLEEEGVLPVSAEFLSVSPQACPQPFQVGAQLRSRSSPSNLQRAGRGGEDTAKGALGIRPRNLGFKGRGQGHTCARWQSRVQPPALPGAGVEQEGCPGNPAPLPPGKAIGCNRA